MLFRCKVKRISCCVHSFNEFGFYFLFLLIFFPIINSFLMLMIGAKRNNYMQESLRLGFSKPNLKLPEMKFITTCNANCS